MRVYRICRKPYAALDGVGGLYTSGRWHAIGRPIIYTASSAALAALEVLVHVDPLAAPSDLRLLTIELPARVSIETLRPAALPRRWSRVPAPASLQRLGMAWLQSARTAALIVPSAVIPSETNVLVNPRHPDAGGLRLVRNEAFSFDARLL